MRSYKLLIVKILVLGTFIGMVILGTFSCSPTTEDILQKYKEFPVVSVAQNKLGLKNGADKYAPLTFSFQNTFVNLIGAKNIMEIEKNLSEIGHIFFNDRFIVLDAEKPSKRVEFTTTHFSVFGNIPDIRVNPDGKSRFIIVGFKGVKESESAKWATPALFYIYEKVEDDFGGSYQLITPNPLLAGTLFDTNYVDAQLVEIRPIVPVIIQTDYSTQIATGSGKTLSLSFVFVSEDDEKRIATCEINVATRTYNSNGSVNETGNKYYGYDIKVGADGKFNQKISDYVINGTVAKDRITGSIRGNGTSYNFSAKTGTIGNPSMGNTSLYRSIESSTIGNSSISDPLIFR